MQLFSSHWHECVKCAIWKLQDFYEKLNGTALLIQNKGEKYEHTKEGNLCFPFDQLKYKCNNLFEHLK